MGFLPTAPLMSLCGALWGRFLLSGGVHLPFMPRARPHPCPRLTPSLLPASPPLGGSPALLGGSPAGAGVNILPVSRDHPRTAAPVARVRGMLPAFAPRWDARADARRSYA